MTSLLITEIMLCYFLEIKAIVKTINANKIITINIC